MFLRLFAFLAAIKIPVAEWFRLRAYPKTQNGHDAMNFGLPARRPARGHTRRVWPLDGNAAAGQKAWRPSGGASFRAGRRCAGRGKTLRVFPPPARLAHRENPRHHARPGFSDRLLAPFGLESALKG